MQDFDITGSGDVWYARPQLFSSALFAALVRWTLPADIRSIFCFFSAHLNPSALFRIAACRGRVFPCCTNDWRQYCRLFTSVQWRMCWVECHWFRVTWMATQAIQYSTSTWELYQQKQLLIQDRTVEREVVFSRSTSGWMWRYGRTFPREIAVTDSVELRKKRLADSRIRAAATMKRRREAQVIARAQNDD